MHLGDWFSYFVDDDPHATFAVQGDRHVSRGEADGWGRRFARRLAAAGVGRGDRFAWLSKNSIDMAMAYVAATRTGAVPVPLNYRLAPPEWAYIAADAKAKVLVVDAAFVDALDGVADRLPDVADLLVVGGPAPAGGRWRALDDWLADDVGDVDLDEPDIDDVLYQMYTSGTTGRPKGVLLTHRQVMANLDQIEATWVHRLDSTDRMLICAPMYHASGALPVIATARWGIGVVIHADFVPAAVVDALADGGVANTTLVPVMIQACLAVPGVEQRDFPRLKTISYGASAIPEPVMVRAIEVFGCELVQGFGQTEATSCITMLTDADHRAARAGRLDLLASVGRPLPGTEVRIVSTATGEPCPPGEIGEILCRGPQVMQGYWNAPEQTAATLESDGWLHTGDAGYVDAEGYLYIRDRIKDMIVTGGTNVYSVEVEQVVATHPAVADVAVIGVPDDKWGETVLAIVALRDGAALTLDELQAHCRPFLGGYKLPRRLEVVDALPRNASGKVLKHVVRAPYWAGHDRAIG